MDDGVSGVFLSGGLYHHHRCSGLEGRRVGSSGMAVVEMPIIILYGVLASPSGDVLEMDIIGGVSNNRIIVIDFIPILLYPEKG